MLRPYVIDALILCHTLARTVSKQTARWILSIQEDMIEEFHHEGDEHKAVCVFWVCHVVLCCLSLYGLLLSNILVIWASSFSWFLCVSHTLNKIIASCNAVDSEM